MLAVTSSAALAERGHVFSKSFASQCSAEPCAPGTLKEPDGVAVEEATGDVYVVDKAANLVTKFDSAGQVVGTFGNNGPNGSANGQLAGSRATVEGTLTLFAGGTGTASAGLGEGVVSAGEGFGALSKGSEEVTEVDTLTGAFTVGEEISGGGIPAGTTIAKVGPGATLQLSAAATASQGAATGTGTTSASSSEITEVDTLTGAFAVGEEISGNGIQAGAKILGIGNGFLHISVTVIGSGLNIALHAGVGLHAASKVLTGVKALSGAFVVGQEIEGPGIGVGTTITAVNAGAKTVELSSLPTQNGTVLLGAGSREVTAVQMTSGTFEAGKEIVGVGIRPGTSIVEVQGTALILSQPVEPTAGAGVTLASGSHEIMDLKNESDALTAGQEIEGPGIVKGTTITEVNRKEGVLVISASVAAGATAVKLTAKEQFSQPEAIAVDNTCFDHEQETNTPLSSGECATLDPSNGDVYVTDGHVVDKFSATGAYLDQLTNIKRLEELGNKPSNPLRGLDVDPHGRLWVKSELTEVTGNGSDESDIIFVFGDAEANELLYRVPDVDLGGGCVPLPGFAVDSHDDLYVNEMCGVAKFTPEERPRDNEKILNPSVFPEPASGLATELGTDDVYVDHGVAVARIGPDGLVEGRPIESLEVPGGGGTGVGVNSKTGALYVADSKGTVQLYELEKAAPPTVEKEEVSDVTGDSATLEAVINPRSEESEEATSYWFEYGPCASLSACPTAQRTQVATLPPSFNVDTVTPVNVQGLVADTLYSYRVAAGNGHENGRREKTIYGPERTFTTQNRGEFTLPDGREWEMVSPPLKHGAELEAPIDESPAQAAAAGDAMVFSVHSPTEAAPDGYSGTVQVLSVRGASGWSSEDLALPHETVAVQPAGKGAEVRVFSDDLSHAIVQPFDQFVACHSAEGAPQPCLSEEASEQTAFLRTDYMNTDPAQPCVPPAMHCYQPLVTDEAPYADDTASPFVPFSEHGEGGPTFLDASPNLEHVVLESTVALTTPASGGLYEWSADKAPSEQLAPVSILPATEEEVEKGERGRPAGGELGNHDENMRNAISDDGQRVFWSTSGGEVGALYVRDVGKGETLLVAAGREVEFQDASSDGSRVFYSEGNSLWECAIVEVEGKLQCVKTEIATGLANGLIPGISEDGEWVYFVSSSALAEGRPVAGAVEGQPNLYVRHEDRTSLVAVLSSEDSPDWTTNGGKSLTELTARVSPNGQWLAFMSQQELTGYDNRDAVSGTLDEEVYLYDGETGKLVCASCNPSGARPVGAEISEAEGYGAVVDGDPWNSYRGRLAADVPGWNPDGGAGSHSVYQPHYLSNSGRLFFNARDPLVSQAVNNNWDVYEYEPENVPEGSRYACSAAMASGSEVFKPGARFEVEIDGTKEKGEEGSGCVALISSGESPQQSGFLDASESGGDVFFMTTARLSPKDIDNAYDVYDAHECTSESLCTPPAVAVPPPCDTEASCKASQTPQPAIFGAPASATFFGPGNLAPAAAKPVVKSLTRAQKLALALKACRKKPAKRRAKCEATAHRSYGTARKSAKSTHRKGSK
jgi:hypothetical protein